MFSFLPEMQLSSIIGVAATVFTSLQQIFPGNPWLPGVVAGLSAVVLNEQSPSK